MSSLGIHHRSRRWKGGRLLALLPGPRGSHRLVGSCDGTALRLLERSWEMSEDHGILDISWNFNRDLNVYIIIDTYIFVSIPWNTENIIMIFSVFHGIETKRTSNILWYVMFYNIYFMGHIVNRDLLKVYNICIYIYTHIAWMGFKQRISIYLTGFDGDLMGLLWEYNRNIAD